MFPLSSQKRKDTVHDFIESGFSAVITIVNTKKLPGGFLGRILDKKTADSIESSGADICGENGEYHTFVFDGPIFENKIEFSVAGQFEKDNYCILKIE
jgi:diphthamide synthase (EF-2-diphthine--ammonia ligase)